MTFYLSLSKNGSFLLIGALFMVIFSQITTSGAKNKNSENTLSTDNNKKVDEHVVRRVAFDIGSLTTKMIVADVDIATNTIQNIVLKEVRHAGYRGDVERAGGDGSISPQMIAHGVQALKDLKARADSLLPAPQEYAAVATASLRKTTNGPAVAQELQEKTGIPVFIIDQDEEARLGFNGAVGNTGFDKSETVVWDMGGGSTQFITLDDSGAMRIFGGEESFIPFTKHVVEAIQHKNIHESSTPNPLSEIDAKEAIEYAAKQVALIPKDIQEKIQKPTTKVVGIGALYYANHELNPTSSTRLPINQELIAGLLSTKLLKTDEELASTTHMALTPTVAATSLALILGYMKALCIDSIYLVEVNMTDGLLVSPHYYIKPTQA